MWRCDGNNPAPLESLAPPLRHQFPPFSSAACFPVRPSIYQARIFPIIVSQRVSPPAHPPPQNLKNTFTVNHKGPPLITRHPGLFFPPNFRCYPSTLGVFRRAPPGSSIQFPIQFHPVPIPTPHLGSGTPWPLRLPLDLHPPPPLCPQRPSAAA